MNNVEISINKTPEFTEVWHSGFVEHEGARHNFWLIDPQGVDSQGNQYEPEIRWFFKTVPSEIRAIGQKIIDQYLEMKSK